MPQKPPSTTRLEAFSDGVIAVIITIMVLELKVPHQEGIAGFYALMHIFLIYLLSFTFTGIYWINHQHVLDRIQSASHAVLYANLFFLFCLSLLPFFTAYVLEKGMNSFAVFLYAVSLFVTGLSFLMLRLAIHRDLRRSGDLREEDTSARSKHLASLALYLVAIPLTWLYPRLVLVLLALVTVVWIIPNLALHKYPD
ncbi:MAG: DUF1211 domain-containing protein [Acidobacteriaceae bacterium]|nr:DUF1211 domain-containing protein [Acidobacteriaceae bacterium]